ncbi:hypothetical protein IEQ_05013 [Bacillus cereus BAG6X1-2]|nr:hypothetical protein IEQ_05013 [Bacillus cereus BAG6X1-2]
MGEILSIIFLVILVSSCTNWMVDIIKVIREKRDVKRMVEKEMEQLKAIKQRSDK